MNTLVCERVCVCVSLASPVTLGVELVEEREEIIHLDCFLTKHMEKRTIFFLFPPTIAINISRRTFAHVPLRTGIPAETKSSWRIRQAVRHFHTYSQRG